MEAKMQIHVMQHTPLEDLDSIAQWGADHEHEFIIHRLDLDDNIATLNPAEMDGMIILGGPMSVNDELDFLSAERILIRSLDKLNRPVLGICLGAQQIVRAFGAAVYPLDTPELGFAPVTDLTTQTEFSPFHWHGEAMADLPGSELLFSDAVAKNQGFRYHHTLGLQFHLELQPETIATLVQEDPLAAGLDITTTGDFAGNQARLNELLDSLFQA